MDGKMWFVLIILSVMFLMSIILMLGKGSFLIAGYNTSSKEEKEKYDEKKLCRVVGAGLFFITAITGIGVIFEDVLPQWYHNILLIGILASVAVLMILSNTICRKK